MEGNDFFKYQLLQYDLAFDDIYSLAKLKRTGIIDYLFDEVFEIASDALMFNKYLIVLSMLGNKRNLYLDGIVDTIYDNFVTRIYTDLDDVGYYRQLDGQYIPDTFSDTETVVGYTKELDFLSTQENTVRQHMMLYTYLLFTNIYHNVYQFIQQANAAGVTFSSMTHRQCPITRIRTIICYTNPEVVKDHDPAWYDRLSLLHPV